MAPKIAGWTVRHSSDLTNTTAKYVSQPTLLDGSLVVRRNHQNRVVSADGSHYFFPLLGIDCRRHRLRTAALVFITTRFCAVFTS